MINVFITSSINTHTQEKEGGREGGRQGGRQAGRQGGAREKRERERG
jgi:hypothetical protein